VRTTAVLPCLAAALALAGCAMQQQQRDDAQWAATAPVAPAAAPAVDGAIYHDEQGMELFADPRAHRTGDILTVVLVENTQAVKKASTRCRTAETGLVAVMTRQEATMRIAAKI